jgi:EmrB/QacA subfamily drug resistance transporter
VAVTGPVPPVDPRYPLGKRRTVIVMTGVVLAIFVASVSHLMLVTAVPQVLADLGSVADFTWVFAGYFLASTVSLPFWGKLSDIYGRKPLFTVAIVIYMVGATVCGFAQSMDMLLAGRVLQGLGTGGIVPCAMAISADVIAARERGKWQAYLASGTIVSSMAGPLIGGWLTDVASWRWTFFAVIPLGVVALLVIQFGVKLTRVTRPHTLDYAGAVLLLAGLVCALLAVNWGGRNYAWDSKQIVGLFAAGGVLLVVFGWWEGRAAEPIVPLSLFGLRTFAVGQIALFALGAAHWCSQTYIPLLAQGALGASSTGAGAILTSLMLASILASVAAGQFVSRTGRYRPVLLASGCFVLAGYTLLSHLSAPITRPELLRDMIVLGIGLGLGTAMYSVVVQNAVPKAQLGVASAANQFSRTIGGTIMLSVLGAVITARLHTEILARVPNAKVDGVDSTTLFGNNGLPQRVQDAYHDAFSAAVPHMFAVMVPLASVILLATLWLPSTALGTSVDE